MTTPLPPPSYPEYAKNSVSKSGEIVKIVIRPALYTADQMQAYATQARADLEAQVQRFREHLTKQNAELDELIPMAQRLEAENQRLREALESVHQWMDDQADAQSKGGHATFDLMMLREQRDRARAAIARATHKEQT